MLAAAVCPTVIEPGLVEARQRSDPTRSDPCVTRASCALLRRVKCVCWEKVPSVCHSTAQARPGHTLAHITTSHRRSQALNMEPEEDLFR